MTQKGMKNIEKPSPYFTFQKNSAAACCGLLSSALIAVGLVGPFAPRARILDATIATTLLHFTSKNVSELIADQSDVFLTDVEIPRQR